MRALSWKESKNDSRIICHKTLHGVINCCKKTPRPEFFRTEAKVREGAGRSWNALGLRQRLQFLPCGGVVVNLYLMSSRETLVSVPLALLPAVRGLPDKVTPAAPLAEVPPVPCAPADKAARDSMPAWVCA